MFLFNSLSLSYSSSKSCINHSSLCCAFPICTPSPFSRELAVTMRTVEHPADFLSPPQRALWDINLVRSFLSFLSPDNSNVVFGNPALVYSNKTDPPSVQGDCTDPTATRHNFNVSSVDRIEYYFGSLYGVYCTESRLIQKWENLNIPEGTFFLPEFQKYAPGDLSLLPLPADYSTTPLLVLDNGNGRFDTCTLPWWCASCAVCTVCAVYSS